MRVYNKAGNRVMLHVRGHAEAATSVNRYLGRACGVVRRWRRWHGYRHKDVEGRNNGVLGNTSRTCASETLTRRRAMERNRPWKGEYAARGDGALRTWQQIRGAARVKLEWRRNGRSMGGRNYGPGRHDWQTADRRRVERIKARQKDRRDGHQHRHR